MENLNIENPKLDYTPTNVYLVYNNGIKVAETNDFNVIKDYLDIDQFLEYNRR